MHPGPPPHILGFNDADDLRADLVACGSLTHSIRATPKRPLHVGDPVMLCRYIGTAAPQRRELIRHAKVRELRPIIIAAAQLTLDGIRMGQRDEEFLAYLCGWAGDYPALRAHYLARHSPYTGLLIRW